MKRLLPVVLILLVLAACKTNEKNYRAAYEIAAQHAREKTGLDPTVYGEINRDGHVSYLIVGNDSLPMRTEIIGYTENGGSSREHLQRYNIAVGKFKQLFNAQEMRKRLMNAGYEAFILHTREPQYYVLTATQMAPSEALKEYQKVQADTSLVLRNPFPFILRPAHLAR